MAVFAYQALDASGSMQRGHLEADSSRQLRQVLRDQGLTPLKIDAADQAPTRAFTPKPRGTALGGADRALITRQLATLLQAGIPLEEALAAVAAQSETARVKALVLSVRSLVLEGLSFAQALAEFPRAFDRLYRATVSAGEQAGHLDRVLASLADYAELAHRERQQAQLALLYPAILLGLSVLIVAGLMVYVVPDVVEVFSAQGQALPLLTRLLMSTSAFLVDYGLWCLLLIPLLAFGVHRLLQEEGPQRLWHKTLLNLPLLAKLVRGADCARFANTLSILTRSGVPLVEALTIAIEVLQNRCLREAAAEAIQAVEEGGSLHRALETSGQFPAMMIHMIASGEASGELDQMLSRVADHQLSEQSNLRAALLGIFEPMMLLLMGGLVLMIVLAILQPIFDINGLI